MNVSHDGGLHWDEPTLIQADGVDSSGNLTPSNFFNDKIWLAADQSSGRVYVTWTRFADNPDGSYLESPIVRSHQFQLRPHVLAVPAGRHHAGRFPPGWAHPVLPGLQPEGRPRRHALHRLRG